MTHRFAHNQPTLPRAVGAAAELVLASRGDHAKLMRIFNRTPVPMVMIDGQRRYVEVNRPARLVFRLTPAEMRQYAVDDLTPEGELPTMEAAWTRLLEAGCVAGPYKISGPDGGKFDVVYWALADALPGLHLVAFVLAGWPTDEFRIVAPADGPLPSLSPREEEILQLAAEGLSGPGIAERLTVSEATVKTHFAHIYDKLGVHDRTAAVARGLRLGLID